MYEELAHVSKNLEITYTYTSSETGIEEVFDEVKGESGKVKGVYDLQGREVNNPVRGIYIIDGKKVFIK